LAPAALEDAGIEASFRDSFNDYDKQQCASIVREWILDDLAATGKINEAANDPASQPSASTPAHDHLIDEVVNLLKAG
jgi:hypothetical protein